MWAQESTPKRVGCGRSNFLLRQGDLSLVVVPLLAKSRDAIMTMNDFVHFQRHKLLRLHMAHSKDVEVEAPETGIDEINSSRHWLMC